MYHVNVFDHNGFLDGYTFDSVEECHDFADSFGHGVRRQITGWRNGEMVTICQAG